MRALRFVTRGATIALILVVQLLIWLLGWFALLLSFRGKERRQAWFAARMRSSLIALGATFVKVGQIMSTRPDLLPPHIVISLESLQDDVGAFAYRHVRRTFIDDFGKPPEEIFASFSETPIASASVAQVHLAELEDGRRVAVKVRRPHLEQIVDFDLRAMKFVARVACIVPSVRLFAPVASVMEFGRAIEMQIDLANEAAHNDRFRANFAAVDPDLRVGFPDLVREFCSRRVLTMSFVEGRKVLDFDPATADPTHLARVGFHTLLKMVFEDGFVHADLHPGNILVTAEGNVVLLDFGLVSELDDSDRRGFARFFAAWASRDGAGMARMMVELAPGSEPRDYAAYEADVIAFVNRYHGKAVGDVQVSRVVYDMMGILRTHRVRVNPSFTMCNIAIAVTEGIGKQLAPDLDLLTEAVPFFMRLQQEAKL